MSDCSGERLPPVTAGRMTLTKSQVKAIVQAVQNSKEVYVDGAKIF